MICVFKTAHIKVPFLSKINAVHILQNYLTSILGTFGILQKVAISFFFSYRDTDTYT